MIAEVETGEAREVWKCPDESGGFVQEYAASPLQWASGGQLLFYSEHEGWTHIYSLPSGGGPPVCLTSGDFDVEDSALSPDRKTLVFNSNSGDLDRRHLWSVPTSGGTPEVLTPGKGIEWAPVWGSNSDVVAFLCSTATQPAAPAVEKREEGACGGPHLSRRGPFVSALSAVAGSVRSRFRLFQQVP
jgi:hypothetical protein